MDFMELGIDRASDSGNSGTLESWKAGKLESWHPGSPQPDTRKPSFSTSHYRLRLKAVFWSKLMQKSAVASKRPLAFSISRLEKAAWWRAEIFRPRRIIECGRTKPLAHDNHL